MAVDRDLMVIVLTFGIHATASTQVLMQLESQAHLSIQAKSFHL
jgi:hypothetical protein